MNCFSAFCLKKELNPYLKKLKDSQIFFCVGNSQQSTIRPKEEWIYVHGNENVCWFRAKGMNQFYKSTNLIDFFCNADLANLLADVRGFFPRSVNCYADDAEKRGFFNCFY